MTPTDPDERRARQAIGFARMLVAYIDADPVVRQSAEAMARGIDRSGMTPADRASAALSLADILIEEIDRNHR